MDPRVHFALVCGAKSCPPIKVYTAASLHEGLESATTAFCEGELSCKERWPIRQAMPHMCCVACAVSESTGSTQAHVCSKLGIADLMTLRAISQQMCG